MTKTLEDLKSNYNGEIKVVRSLAFGTYIQVKNLTQSGGIIYDIWKTTFKKVQGKKVDVKNALILGLGGGTLVKVIHKFWHDTKITGVDVDPLMIEMGKKHLKLDSEEVDIIVSDATAFCIKAVKEKKKYDLICIDMYNGDIFPPQFEQEEFLKIIQKLLAEDGVAIFNRLYYGDKRSQAAKFGRVLEKSFKNVEVVYPEANVMFVCKN